MADLHPIARTLLAVVDNQVARTDAALEGLDDAVARTDPGGGCNTILGIGRHLVGLRRFQLMMLGSPRAADIADPSTIDDLHDLRTRLDDATAILRAAVETHDPDDWFHVPSPARDGKWGDEPTIHRLVRPLNDFTNHLGGIRAIRRIRGNANDRTQ